MGNVAVLVALLLLWEHAFAKNPALELDESFEKQKLGRFVNIYHDYEKKLTFEDILELNIISEFIPSEVDSPNFGVQEGAYWFSFEIANTSKKTLPIIIENQFSYVDEMELYHLAPQGINWDKGRAGDTIPFSERDINTRLPSFQFLLEPGIHRFVGKVQSIGANQLPLVVWAPKEFYLWNTIEYCYIGLLLGGYIIVALYNFFLGISLRDSTYLVYVGYVLSNLAFQGIYLGLLQQSFHMLGWAELIHPHIQVHLVVTIAIFALIFSMSFLKVKEQTPKMYGLFKAALLWGGLNYLITAFVSFEFGTLMSFVTAMLSITVLVFACALIIRRDNTSAKFFMLAWAFYISGVSLAISNQVGLIETSYVTQWSIFTGGVIEVAILSLALGARINEKKKETIEQIRELNLSLEEKVADRTAKFRFLLRHIPQGILSLGNDGRVDTNYSTKLTEILGHGNIAGKSFYDLVLKNLVIDSDEREQIWQVIRLTVGSHALNFELNSEKLPKTMTYRRSAGDLQYLRVTWNTEVDGWDNVSHLLITILDVSSEYQAQENLKEKDSKFEIIRQLVEVGAKKSSHFFNSALPLIEENKFLLQKCLNPEQINSLFINTHTLKGSARSLGFRALSDKCHELENSLAHFKQDDDPSAVDAIQMQWNSLLMVFQNYHHANTNILDRYEDGTSIKFSKQFISDHAKLLIGIVDSVNLNRSVKARVLEHRMIFTSKVSTELKDLMDDIVEQAESIALDIGKEPPNIVIEMPNIVIDSLQEAALRNGLLHLLRNILDHGIEPSERRQQLGKSRQGTIRITAQESDQFLTLEISDDGRGIALSKIKDLGLEQRLISNTADNIEVANLIFLDGFSTSSRVSQVSGRGMGMGAVRRFLESLGGSIELELKCPHHHNKGYCVFKTVIRLPKSLPSVVQPKVS